MRENRRRRSVYEGFSVTIESDRNVWVDGCLAILVYESDNIVLRLRKRNLIINGSSLMLKSFSRHELCISGLVSSVLLNQGV